MLFTMVVLLGGYWGATHQAELQVRWEDLKAKFMGTSAQDVSAQPAMVDTGPLPQPPLPESPPPPQPARVAPLEEGVYYTRERITQVTDAGVKVINARVRVTKVGEKQEGLVVDDGRQRVVTSASNLTNDPVEVAALLDQPISTPATAAVPVTEAAPMPGTPPRNDPSTIQANKIKYRQNQVMIDELGRSIISVSRQVTALQRESAVAKMKGRPSTHNDREIANLNHRIAAMEAQRARLRMEQASIPR